MKVLDDIDRAEVLVRYRAGMSTTGLARRFGVSTHAIRACIPDSEMRGKGWQAKAVPDEEIVRLREREHLSWAQIGERTGLHLTTARTRYLKFLAACRSVAGSSLG